MSANSSHQAPPRPSASIAEPETVVEAARRQTIFREVNENIARLTGLATDAGYSLFICECSDTRCAESLEIAPAEYEAVRADGTRFVIVPGHQLDGIERVVERNARFAVVEKVGGAAHVAVASDPRRA